MSVRVAGRALIKFDFYRDIAYRSRWIGLIFHFAFQHGNSDESNMKRLERPLRAPLKIVAKMGPSCQEEQNRNGLIFK